MSEIMHVPSSTLLHHAHIIYFQEKKQIMPMIQNNNNANLSADRSIINVRLPVHSNGVWVPSQWIMSKLKMNKNGYRNPKNNIIR